VASARANRAFLRRVVRFLVTEAGVRQFLDLGTGIPASDNTHEVAQSLAPQSRVVYVDNDPVVLAHARALLNSTPEGATDYLDADLREPGPILARAAQTLDFSRPVAIMLLAVLHLLGDDDEPYRVVTDLLAAVAPGSYLALSHPTSDVSQDQVTAMVARLNDLVAEKVTTRGRDQVARFLAGLDLVSPDWSTCPSGGPMAPRRPRGRRRYGWVSPVSRDCGLGGSGCGSADAGMRHGRFSSGRVSNPELVVRV
jgi:S-adenosyl methyltransferase